MSGILISLLRIFSLLPLSILFLFSDLFYFVLYRVAGYRKAVIQTNLQRSFPERTSAELKLIEKKFYRFFCDMIFETFKNFSIPGSKIENYLKVENPELLDRYADEGKHVLIVMGHYGNWEFTLSMLNAVTKHDLKVLYKPFKSELFHDVLSYERNRHGVEIIPMKSALRTMMKFERPSATVFIADQAPSNVDTLWTTFLHQETPIFEGPERIASRLKMPVVFLKAERYARGKYKIHFREICSDASQTTENEISLKHTRMLEEDIRKAPETWLWSHKRWKRKRPQEISLTN